MRTVRWIALTFTLIAVAVFSVSPAIAQMKPGKTLAERGKYLVNIAGCNDCHSPKVFTPMGPMPDTTRLLSGHPASAVLPPYPDSIIGMTPDKWGAVTTGDLTAWRGPWGTSFPFNLTPDKETGLGSWTVDMFIKALRTGKHMGKGRNILPPMPWMFYGQMTDQDLKSIFAYLRTLKPVSNAVPDPVPPPGAVHK